MARKYTIGIVFLLLVVISFSEIVGADNKRPIYNIAHMVNKISQIRQYLELGANVIESDIQFHSNGSVRRVYHGIPCDYARTCTFQSKLSDFLSHVRYLTDASTPNSYKDKLVMQFFDLKIKDSNTNKKRSGREIAQHVLDYLWSADGSRNPEVRVLVYIVDLKNIDVVRGFLEEFQTRGKTSKLKYVGFDFGENNLMDIERKHSQLPVRVNVWQGYGITNWINAVYDRYRQIASAITVRDSRQSFIQKVYDWTIDTQVLMKVALLKHVDGIITNDPHDLVALIQHPFYRDNFRLATPRDDPFAVFHPSIV